MIDMDVTEPGKNVQRRDRLENMVDFFNANLPACSLMGRGITHIFKFNSDKTDDDILAMLEEIYPVMVNGECTKYCSQPFECRFKMESSCTCTYFETYSAMIGKDLPKGYIENIEKNIEKKIGL